MRNYTISSNNEILSAFCTSGDDTCKPVCLLMHGAGLSDKNRLITLANSLHARKIPCLGFDFSGHGQSTSNSPGSIRKRILEAESVVDHMDPNRPLTVCAFSMSGQVALNLFSQLGNRLENIILFAPALYNVSALNVDFGSEFSAIIRRDRSWTDNNARENLESFYGKLLIFTSANDNVIPKEIPEIIYDAAINANKKELVYLENAPHQLAQWMTLEPENAQVVSEKIRTFIVH